MRFYHFDKILSSVVMAHAFISLLSRRTTRLAAVRAFTTPAGRRPVLNANIRTFGSTPPHVEDDLDSALDDVLGDVFAEISADNAGSEAAKISIEKLSFEEVRQSLVIKHYLPRNTSYPRMKSSETGCGRTGRTRRTRFGRSNHVIHYQPTLGQSRIGPGRY